jgi:hypothetical protein
MNVTIICIIILIGSFIGAFGRLIKFEYDEWKSERDFNKRQKRYKKML